jgi:hypothetical protein
MIRQSIQQTDGTPLQYASILEAVFPDMVNGWDKPFMICDEIVFSKKDVDLNNVHFFVELEKTALRTM